MREEQPVVVPKGRAAPRMPDTPERAMLERQRSIREIVFGAQDGLLTTLGVTKGFFILGCCAASFMGVKMRGREIGSMAILVLASFVLIQLAVSVNNLSLIVS